MIGTSFHEYILIRTCVVALRAILPLSFGYCVLNAINGPYSKAFLYAGIWPLAEVCFYLFIFLPLKDRSQRQANHPPLAPRAERHELFQKCQANIPYPREYVSKWFLDAPLKNIGVENMKEFFRWAFLNTSQRRKENEDELSEYVQGTEDMLEQAFESGRRPATSLRLTLDKTKILHRPLVWYVIVMGVDVFTYVWLMARGFSFYRTSLASQLLTVFPPRPQALFAPKTSPSTKLSYWFRPHKSTTKSPVVFLHGIGIGLMIYVPYLSELNKSGMFPADDDVGIIAIELLPISFRITGSMLPREEMCHEINKILEYHGFIRFVLSSHSYGSVVSTHLVKDLKTLSRINSVVLVDPVSLLLHLPHIAYNFTHRKPRKANEYLLWYFASTDVCVSHTLSRGFFWSDNILWLEDLKGKSLSVFLGGKDLIVDTHHVWEYLRKGAIGRRDMPSQEGAQDGEGVAEQNFARPLDQGGKLKVIWSGSLDHAQIFLAPKGRKQLVEQTLRQEAGQT